MRHVNPNARVPVAFAVTLVLLALAPAAAAAPFVRVDDGKLTRKEGRAELSARVTWNRGALDTLSVGDVRAVAVGGPQRRARVLGKLTFAPLAETPVTRVEFTLKDHDDVKAVAPGNRVVITASQHPYAPSVLARAAPTYVTVGELQPPRTRTRVGSRDCSDQPIDGDPLNSLEACDFVGAHLANAEVSTDGEGTRLELADLSGADLTGANLTRADIAGGRLNGADASGALIDRTSMAHTDAVALVAENTTLSAAALIDARLIDAQLEGSQFLLQTSLNHADLDGAHLAGANFDSSDLRIASLVHTDLRNATLVGDLFDFADFTHADLLGATIPGQDLVLDFALLCGTRMPPGNVENRDCPS